VHFDGAFRHIGTIDVERLVAAVKTFGEEAWSEYVRRQEKFNAHRQTETILLLYDEDMRHSGPTAWPRFAQIEPLLEPVFRLIREAAAPIAEAAEGGYFNRIILTRLSPGSTITPHRDRGDSIMRSHRYHLAIETNDMVHFGIDGQLQHFAPGEIWEINNRKYHAVRNLGRQKRIHLILDYVVPGEKIEDPDEGLLVA